MQEFKSGTVSIIGKPNTGKSTLINLITDRRISAVSDKPNTTRNKILGVYNRDNTQILFLDTPGFQKSKKFLNRIMIQSSMQAIGEGDIILLLIDATKKILPEDDELFRKIEGKNSIIAINKIDLIKKSKILNLINKLSNEYSFVKSFVPISALENQGIDLLIKEFMEYLPHSQKLMPDGIYTDQAEKFYISEIIREKIYINLFKEVPYRTAVVIEEMIDKKKIIVIQSYIVVESSQHKQIILGKKGSMIKKIGLESRKDIQDFLNCKVYLDLRVKIDNQWLKTKDKAFNYSSI
jgi:GTP-binding protein Era|tara:strand:+ start:67392 stop:68273 length:882 start_codon:yes stop_codon:yes gene_type:complete